MADGRGNCLRDYFIITIKGTQKLKAVDAKERDSVK